MPALFSPETDRDLMRSRPERAVLAYDLQGRIIDANRRFHLLAGVTGKGLIGQPISLLQEEDQGQIRAEALPILRRGQIAQVDFVFRSVAGDARTLQAQLLPLTGKAGLCGVLIMGRDIAMALQPGNLDQTTGQDGTRQAKAA